MEEENKLEKSDKKPIAVPDIFQILGPDGIYVSTRCTLCNSKLRKQIDELCENKASPTQVAKFMQDNGETPPHLSNVCHHINEHFRKQANVAILSDYFDNMAALAQCRRDKKELLFSLIDSSTIDLVKVLSIPTNGDISKEKEKVDMDLKIKRDIRENISQLNEMEDVDAQINAVYAKLVKVFQIRIAAAKTEADQQMYIAMMKDFKELFDTTK